MPLCPDCRTLVRVASLATLLVSVGGLTACQAETSAAWSGGTGAVRNVSASGTGAMAGAGKASFTGTSGTARVRGHQLSAHDGNLALDGTPHGTVDARSVAQLLVRDGNTMVTVNGRVRYPDTGR